MNHLKTLGKYKCSVQNLHGNHLHVILIWKFFEVAKDPARYSNLISIFYGGL